MIRRVTLLTTGQPSTNPRLVKEADALASAGFDVSVIGIRRAGWADASDTGLLAGRAWRARLLDPGRTRFGIARVASALRHRLARMAGARSNDAWLAAALSPVAPLLFGAARHTRADLYIAHNLGALPAAAASAAATGAKLGFDAEDFHSGQLAGDSPELEITRLAEARFIPACDYVTAASHGIADRYAPLRTEPPAVVLNVFPRAERPQAPELPAAGGPFRLYWFSQTIGPDRGLEDAVAAMGLLPEFHIELHLRGEWQPGYESSLRERAVRAGVPADRLVGLPPAPAAEMVRLSAPFHAGLALEDGRTINRDIALTNKLFTYLLAGVPVAASATTAQQWFCDQAGAAARAYAPGQPAALASLLRSWLAAPDTLVAARRAAWALGERRFNWDLEQRAFLAVIDRVMGVPGTRRTELAS
jgi:glycosyltransferase involved in cell wall biosynthesis